MEVRRCRLMKNAVDALKNREESLDAAEAAEKAGDAKLAGELRIRAELFDQFAEWMMRESAKSFWSDVEGIAQSIARSKSEVKDGEAE